VEVLPHDRDFLENILTNSWYTAEEEHCEEAGYAAESSQRNTSKNIFVSIWAHIVDLHLVLMQMTPVVVGHDSVQKISRRIWI